ncbi:MAG: DAK2 domain-containing protein [Aerococcus sp.]|nr:DAK2 domain-containing protein [Aerococcus sp.]
MSTKLIDAEQFKQMLEVANQRLTDNADYVNSLNVFPVPDGDTGTNMSLSFQSGVKKVREVDSKRVDELAQALAKGLLLGARGNSGVILSQLFRGFAKGCEGQETLDTNAFAQALAEGVKVAYRAVMKPVEGTILSVAREAGETAQMTSEQTTDIIELMDAIYESAKKALANTPNQLKVLKEVGVVDSGGQGLTFIYMGFLEALTGEEVAITTPDIQNLDVKELAHEENYYNTSHSVSSEDIQYGYCTQMLIRLGQGKTVKDSFDYETFSNHLNELGDSLIVVNDDEFVKVHVHVEYPGEVLSYGQRFGSLATVKVDNMREQHDTILENQGSDANQKAEPKKPYGIIAVAAGAGVQELMQSAGATTIINGGQTMNPSTEDIVKAIEKANAEQIIILPNNKNILMASNQAAEVVDQPAVVVATTSISQGLTALLGFNANNTLAENQVNMEAELENVVSGQVTHAIRDTEIDGLKIKKDDFMGLIDGDIVASGADLETLTVDTIKKMIDDDKEIVTLIYGEDASEDEANAIAEKIEDLYPDIETEIYEGDQPVYNYFISVE